MCDCINQSNELLKNRYSDHQASLVCGIDLFGNIWPVIKAEYHSNGFTRTVSVIPTFCPFCGQKYTFSKAPAVRDGGT